MTHIKPSFEEADKTDAVAREDGITVCFVCTGNTCRSPMAQAAFNYLFKDIANKAYSAGIYAHTGQPISENAILALSEMSIGKTPEFDYEKHTAVQFSPETGKLCDRIITMTPVHAMLLIQAFPEFASKISSFEREVPDPYMGDISVYKECLENIIFQIKKEFGLS